MTFPLVFPLCVLTGTARTAVAVFSRHSIAPVQGNLWCLSSSLFPVDSFFFVLTFAPLFTTIPSYESLPRSSHIVVGVRQGKTPCLRCQNIVLCWLSCGTAGSRLTGQVACLSTLSVPFPVSSSCLFASRSCIPQLC
ncbi:hypothetical protein TGGT1_227640 [Toxoplasma gondii GT1]|uniref:Uncharacterized protein n=3 Tax=Toxoplasma gondii TaxID=5811 RepID=S7UXD2_TOXGG|nr:hypothetical protein TGGT1_227640 [Toxoplasma gondii GT1]KAF4640780.1 hypothetical protein TGRH88_047060 [Toxoplasma gondii]